MAEIRPTIYSNELQKLIYPDNSFYKKSIGESGVADTTERVEKPVQGEIGKAEKVLPNHCLFLSRYRPDKTKYYDTTLIYCKPLLIDSQSELMVNYNKRASKQQRRHLRSIQK